MESELRARVVPLERLAGRAVDQSDDTTSTIEFDAKLLMSAYPAYQAVEWVDSTYHVGWVTPQTVGVGVAGWAWGWASWSGSGWASAWGWTSGSGWATPRSGR